MQSVRAIFTPFVWHWICMRTITVDNTHRNTLVVETEMDLAVGGIGNQETRTEAVQVG